MPKLIKLLQEAASRDLFQFLKLQNKLSQNSVHKTATFYALRFHELGIQQDIIEGIISALGCLKSVAISKLEAETVLQKFSQTH